METLFTGGCACGAIRYVCTAEPVISLNCHCRDCQRSSGSAYASGIFVPAEALTFTEGDPKYYVSTSESGNIASRGFCAACGSPVAAKQSAFPIFIIYAASLDDPARHRPTMDIFMSSAQPWDHTDPALPKYPRGIE
ncbi:MAG: GFA family protein [Deltaproteobacteria bacterium]|nr:GFA family protein [Deltaproteobacteria bacterium]MBI3389062.1 GFA family protein [Deltaproteobacteria bacterium]